MYNGGGGYNTRSAAARLSSTGVTRVLITNLDYGVSDTDIKVQQLILMKHIPDSLLRFILTS